MNMEPQPRLRILRPDADDSSSAPLPCSDDLDLVTLLAAWQTATDKLQHTHQALREEVKRLTDELEAKNRELARKNRLADLGQMAAHVAHEVRNSLVPMTLYLSLLRRRLDQDRGSVDVIDKITSGLGALETTVDDLLTFTADREPRCSTVAVGGVLQEVLESLQPQFTAQQITCRVEVAAAVHLHVDREMFRRALLNLILNAVDAMPSGGELVVTSWTSEGGLELEVADSGAGIPAQALERIFDPFFTTKREGTGLGLAIVQRIAEAHGGEIRVTNCPEGGAAFTLRFPHFAKERAA
jgi:signal transduction histidine kinase